MTLLEIRKLPALEIAACLVQELAGRAEGNGVSGDGWRVVVEHGEPAGVGRLRVPVLVVRIDGEREGEVAAFVRMKTMRGGG